MGLEERVIELEVRLAYQDKLIAALDDVVRDFAARVERLERLAREPRVAIVPSSSDAPFEPDEPPPHY